MTPPFPENTVPLLQQAAELGLKLGTKDRDTLTVQPASRCPPELANALRVHKWHLLVLLQLPFVMAYSQTLNETIFFCQNEDTRNCLIEAGAAPCCIYTRNELHSLIERHRRTPLSVDELLQIHRGKRMFSGRVA